MKLCIDCINFRRPEEHQLTYSGLCTAPESVRTNFVDGTVTHPMAMFERMPAMACGPDGRLFVGINNTEAGDGRAPF